MTNIGIHKVGPSQGQGHSPEAGKKADAGDAKSFSQAVKSGGADAPAAEGGEKTTADLLQEARMNLIRSTGRMVQQAAKDIERENLDKGF